MATVNLYYKWEVAVDGVIERGGSVSLPITITASSGIKHDATYSVASGVAGVYPTAGAKVILNVGTGATDDITDFDFCVITATKAGWVDVVGTGADDTSTSSAILPFIYFPPQVPLVTSVNISTGENWGELTKIV